MLERFEISIIPNDGKHEDTIVQIVDCLDNLQRAAEHIFMCIDDRIAGYTQRLSTIKVRTNKIEHQLNYLQNSMSLKAVKMYSEAKYPANSSYQEYHTLIDPCIPEEDHEGQEKLDFTDIRGINHASHHPKANVNYFAAETNLKEKLQFYYVMGKSLKRKSGDSPQYKVSSVSALLMNEPGLGKHDAHFSTTTLGDRMEEAPDSIGQPWKSLDFESPSYLYAPTLGEVPQIDVPAILPDLPGIVDDEKFTLDLSLQSPIAPSSAVASPMLRIDLPDTGLSLEKPEMKAIELEINPSNLFESVHPPPPPPPETSAIKQPEPSAPPPPPPPPPPPQPPPPPSAPEPTTAPSSEKPKADVKIATPSTLDDRTNLMAAIRAAGGVGKAKLRNTTAVMEKPEDRFSSASVGGDLMADLHAKLALRRKGIAGGAVGALERISRLIPPPPKPNEASDRNSATSECDSQADADEWDE